MFYELWKTMWEMDVCDEGMIVQIVLSFLFVNV